MSGLNNMGLAPPLSCVPPLFQRMMKLFKGMFRDSRTAIKGQANTTDSDSSVTLTESHSVVVPLLKVLPRKSL
jgi:hypothetical protein